MENKLPQAIPRRHFAQHVDKRSRKAMAAFLAGHFRYPTANAWNRSTSYACDMKITHMGLPSGIEDRLLDLAQTDEFYQALNRLIAKFDERHDALWQAGWNGRSGGYLVLYQGGAKPSDHKSICLSCGQRNFGTVEESGTKCGRCGSDTRVNFQPLPEAFKYPGKSVDMDMGFEEFMEMDMADLRARTALVCEFDALADRIADRALKLAETMTVRDQMYLVPSTRKIMTRNRKGPQP